MKQKPCPEPNDPATQPSPAGKADVLRSTIWACVVWFALLLVSADARTIPFLRIIALADQEAADAVLSRVAGGGNFALIAKEQSLDEKTGKRFGEVDPSDFESLDPSVKDRISRMREGEVSGIKTGTGTYVLVQIVDLSEYRKGAKAFRDGDFSKASRHLLAHVKDNPDAIKARLMLAKISERGKDTAGAETLYREVLGLDPKQEEASSALSMLVRKQAEAARVGKERPAVQEKAQTAVKQEARHSAPSATAPEAPREAADSLPLKDAPGTMPNTPTAEAEASPLPQRPSVQNDSRPSEEPTAQTAVPDITPSPPTHSPIPAKQQPRIAAAEPVREQPNVKTEEPPTAPSSKKETVRTSAARHKNSARRPEIAAKRGDTPKEKRPDAERESASLRIVVSADREAAERSLGSVQRGTPLAIVAKEHSIDENTRDVYGFLGEVKTAVLDPAIRAALAGMKEGQTSGVLLLQDGRFAVVQIVKTSTLMTGERAFIARDYAEAEKKLREYLDDNPDSVKARTMLGKIYEERKEYANAIRMYRNAITYSPKTVLVYERLARVYLVLGDYARARSIYIDGLREIPSAPELAEGVELADILMLGGAENP